MKKPIPAAITAAARMHPTTAPVMTSGKETNDFNSFTSHNDKAKKQQPQGFNKGPSSVLSAITSFCCPSKAEAHSFYSALRFYSVKLLGRVTIQ